MTHSEHVWSQRDPAQGGGALGVIVHGMGRSGTSSVAGLFVASGYFAGQDDELMEPDDGNPAGYYENLNIFRVNEEIISELGATWFAPPAEELQIPLRSTVESKLSEALTELVREAGPAPIVLKDPRIEVMMPLWQPVIEGVLHPVVVIRDPVEIARSLRLRDGTPVAFGLASWEIHMTSLLAHLRGRMVTVARQRDVLASGERARAIVELATAHVSPERAARVNPSDGTGWLRPELHRSRAVAGEHERLLTGRQAALWRWLSSFGSTTLVLDPPEQLLSENEEARAAVQAEIDRAQLANGYGRVSRKLEAANQRSDELGKQLERERARTATEAHRVKLAQQAYDALLVQLDSIYRSKSWSATAIPRAAVRAVKTRAGHRKSQ